MNVFNINCNSVENEIKVRFWYKTKDRTILPYFFCALALKSRTKATRPLSFESARLPTS